MNPATADGRCFVVNGWLRICSKPSLDSESLHGCSATLNAMQMDHVFNERRVRCHSPQQSSATKSRKPRSRSMSRAMSNGSAIHVAESRILSASDSVSEEPFFFSALCKTTESAGMNTRQSCSFICCSPQSFVKRERLSWWPYHGQWSRTAIPLRQHQVGF